jgi:hypothetical protein
MSTPLPIAITLAAAVSTAVAAPAAEKAPYGTAKEAEAMVVKAIAHIKSAGTEKAYQDFTGKHPDFTDRDLKVLAHGQHAKMVGADLLSLRDPDGKAWIKERVELARSKRTFWHDYKFTDPITKKALGKSAYCERLDDTVVCVGIYKR